MDEQNVKNTSKKNTVGVLGLIAFVLSAMVGGGIYDLPQNMAINAGQIGQILSWILTGLIIWFIARSFMILTDAFPSYKTGLYLYAGAGFGRFAGFFVSWGYWICECFANVAYAVLLMSTIDTLFPSTFNGGKRVAAIIGGSIILWLMSILINQGIKGASWVDMLGTLGMLLSVTIFLVVMAIHFKWSTFNVNMLADKALPQLQDKSLGSLLDQVKNTMMTTLWVFGGIEGAVVLSDRSRSPQDVVKATKYGFLLCLLLYAAASLLPLGIASYGQIANMTAPSSAQLLETQIGVTGRLVITFGVIIAVLSSWLTWTLMLSEMPYAAAKAGNFPKQFAQENQHKIPSFSLMASTIVMQVILISTYFLGHAFNSMLNIVGTMTVPPYLISMLFLVKTAWKDETWPTVATISRKRALTTGIFALLGILFMGYAAGIRYTTISFIIYALGIPFFLLARHQFAPTEKPMTKGELIFAGAILAVAIIGLILLFV